MGKGTLAKVMKYELRYLDGCGDFSNMQKEVWELQRQTREILNRSIQIAFHWDYTSQEHHRKTGEYLNVKSETGYKRLDGYIYNCLKGDYKNMAAANLNATLRKAWSKYNASKKEILRGTMSIPSYKQDQPLTLNKDTVKLSLEKGQPTVRLTLFSDHYKKERQFSSNVRFAMPSHDNTQRAIFDNILSREYTLGECQLVYKRPKWFLFLTYTFKPIQHELNPEKILGVDMGETCAIYASTFGEYGSLKIDGGEITAFARKHEARIRSMQNQAAHCGEGRIGHGTKTRVAAVYKAKDRVAHFRDTLNHRYSKALIDYAIKNQCGVIQMEDLTGIKEETGFPKFLRHWTYYDLQSKIEYKAQEHGITVIKINPRYTSQRCSKCGNIDKANRTSQAKFCCTKCGFSTNADFNASQNISIRNIAKIIETTLSANPKRTEKSE